MHRSARKTKHFPKIKLIGWIFAGIFLAIGIFKLMRSMQASIFLSRRWRTNILFNTQPLTFISFPGHVDDRVIVVTLPDSTYTEVPYGYGSYRLGTISKLGTIEKKEALLSDTVSDLTGLKIAGWLTKTESPKINSSEFIPTQMRNIYLSWGTAGTDITTSLSLFDQLFLGLKLFTLRADQTRMYAVDTNESLVESKTLPDGSSSESLNTGLLTNYLEQKFEETEIRSDMLTIEVLNHTKVPNVGQKFSRFVTMIGGNVINVGNATADITHCDVHVDENNSSKMIVGFLQIEFGCTILNKTDEQKSDIVIGLGESWGKRW